MRLTREWREPLAVRSLKLAEEVIVDGKEEIIQGMRKKLINQQQRRQNENCNPNS